MSTYELNETHDPELSSWVSSANRAGSDFPVQNLPFAEFRRRQTDEAFRGGVAIGEQILDLQAVLDSEVFDGKIRTILQACAEPALNRFMAMGNDAWSGLRLALSRALRSGSDSESVLSGCLVPMAEAEFTLPCVIGDYTDFYTSIHHATNVGKLFRPDNPLLPNYKWLPVGYHGRSSSIIISGQPVVRPRGQTKAPDQEVPTLGPSRRLDYELEVGIYIGPGNAPGRAIDIDEAEQHVFGYCLFNDWSARDIQAWEYVPLGPFLGKSFASTVSPWVVTREALLPYRSAWTRDENEPQPLEYLESKANRAHGAIDLKLQVHLQTETMRENQTAPMLLSESSFAYSYWTVAQMVAHHTVNGCNLRPGDFFGSGTQSGPGKGELGSLLELTEGGKLPLELEGGEKRTFLEDGDSVILSGHCEKPGAARVGFGQAIATIVPAPWPMP